MRDRRTTVSLKPRYTHGPLPLVDLVGFEPTNLLCAKQALYQLELQAHQIEFST